MHRGDLLDQLRAYGLRHPEERGRVDRFVGFVESHPDCFQRSLAVGHVTGSAWLVDEAGGSVLLTHHRKLGRWLQPGGHADGESDVRMVALREAEEESRLDRLEVEESIFDIDIHRIPERASEPGHLHYDVRYVVRHSGCGDYAVTEESFDLAWVPLGELDRFSRDPSVRRMGEKWAARLEAASAGH